jgi:2-polyprenyl-3-methyl-5-hydroxy-6-metoxy-1,4-benzoquinol methylase
MSDLCKHPEDYDLERLGDKEEIAFYLWLGRQLVPHKVLELGCGTGRITLPLALLDLDLVGLDRQSDMLEQAKESRLEAPIEVPSASNSLKATCVAGPPNRTST